MTDTRPAVSAMFPCYNDERTIGGLVDDVHAALEPITSDLEVIVVNDGSSDGSREVLDSLAADRPWLRVIHHERNRGYGGALITGFTAARNDWIFYTDGDAQYDAKEAADLVPLATQRRASTTFTRTRLRFGVARPSATTGRAAGGRCGRWPGCGRTAISHSAARSGARASRRSARPAR